MKLLQKTESLMNLKKNLENKDKTMISIRSSFFFLLNKSWN